MKKISIIIVTYNSGKLIFDCLDSIFKFNDIGDSLEVIIVDNCSKDTDSMFTQICERYVSGVKLYRAESNKGYGAGNNLGVKYSTAPFFIVMNPDVRFVSPTLKKIVGIMEGDEDLGLLGVQFVDGSMHLHFKPEYDNLFTMLFGNFIIKLGLYQVEKMFFSGSFLVFNKSAFLSVQGFDENIFLFYEEADISNRLLKSNKKTLISKDIFVEHLVHDRKVDLNLLRIGAQTREYYFRKYNTDIDVFYKQYLLMWKIKLLIAKMIRDEYRIKHIIPWIDLCKRKGKI